MNSRLFNNFFVNLFFSKKWKLFRLSFHIKKNFPFHINKKFSFHIKKNFSFHINRNFSFSYKEESSVFLLDVVRRHFKRLIDSAPTHSNFPAIFQRRAILKIHRPFNDLFFRFKNDF